MKKAAYPTPKKVKFKTENLSGTKSAYSKRSYNSSARYRVVKRNDFKFEDGEKVGKRSSLVSEERKGRKSINQLPIAKMNSLRNSPSNRSIASRRSTEFHDAILDKEAIRAADRDYAKYKI